MLPRRGPQLIEPLGFGLGRDHATHSLRERRTHGRVLAKVALPLGGLLRQDMVLEGMAPSNLARPSQAETFRGTTMGLEFGHGLCLSESGPGPAKDLDQSEPSRAGSIKRAGKRSLPSNSSYRTQSPTPAKAQPSTAPIRASVPRLQIVERQPSVVLAQLLLQYEVLPRKAREHGADPGLRAQRGAATGGAVGNGLRGSGRRNGVTAEHRQLTGESAGRGVPESARGRNTALRGLRDTAGKALGTHARCPKHPETGLVRARCGKSPGWPEFSGDLGSTDAASLTLLL